jgi:hypothetical protein
MRRCKVCKNAIPTFAKSETFWAKRGYCSIDCTATGEATKAKAARERLERKETQRRRDRIKTLTEWLTEAQAAFNAYIRARDQGLGCISCGTMSDSVQYHAGHYRTRKAAPQLRFDERQVWLQCSTCNNHLSGNLIQYRRELVKRIGEAEVDRIECDYRPARFTIDDARRIKAEYKAKLKEAKPRQPSQRGGG